MTALVVSRDPRDSDVRSASLAGREGEETGVDGVMRKALTILNAMLKSGTP